LAETLLNDYRAGFRVPVCCSLMPPRHSLPFAQRA
jgi:hypothetical protein